MAFFLSLALVSGLLRLGSLPSCVVVLAFVFWVVAFSVSSWSYALGHLGVGVLGVSFGLGASSVSFASSWYAFSPWSCGMVLSRHAAFLSVFALVLGLLLGTVFLSLSLASRDMGSSVQAGFSSGSPWSRCTRRNMSDMRGSNRRYWPAAVSFGDVPAETSAPAPYVVRRLSSVWKPVMQESRPLAGPRWAPSITLKPLGLGLYANHNDTDIDLYRPLKLRYFAHSNERVLWALVPMKEDAFRSSRLGPNGLPAFTKRIQWVEARCDNSYHYAAFGFGSRVTDGVLRSSAYLGVFTAPLPLADSVLEAAVEVLRQNGDPASMERFNASISGSKWAP
jgi:hypothetical protein